ncbi:hypothetical protein K1719_042910 [Acacia pycnantha]|nr:hypothetical protein K1719_042910 [Acacia pycnantha]
MVIVVINQVSPKSSPVHGSHRSVPTGTIPLSLPPSSLAANLAPETLLLQDSVNPARRVLCGYLGKEYSSFTETRIWVWQ